MFVSLGNCGSVFAFVFHLLYILFYWPIKGADRALLALCMTCPPADDDLGTDLTSKSTYRRNRPNHPQPPALRVSGTWKEKHIVKNCFKRRLP